jgi:hypothetical protein
MFEVFAVLGCCVDRWTFEDGNGMLFRIVVIHPTPRNILEKWRPQTEDQNTFVKPLLFPFQSSQNDKNAKVKVYSMDSSLKWENTVPSLSMD